MKILPSSISPYHNLRFRTYDDSQKFLRSIMASTPLDWSLCVSPYEAIDVVPGINKEYISAPYELSLVEFEKGDNELVNCATP